MKHSRLKTDILFRQCIFFVLDTFVLNNQIKPCMFYCTECLEVYMEITRWGQISKVYYMYNENCMLRLISDLLDTKNTILWL